MNADFLTSRHPRIGTAARREILRNFIVGSDDDTVAGKRGWHNVYNRLKDDFCLLVAQDTFSSWFNSEYIFLLTLFLLSLYQWLCIDRTSWHLDAPADECVSHTHPSPAVLWRDEDSRAVVVLVRVSQVCSSERQDNCWILRAQNKELSSLQRKTWNPKQQYSTNETRENRFSYLCVRTIDEDWTLHRMIWKIEIIKEGIMTWEEK